MHAVFMGKQGIVFDGALITRKNPVCNGGFCIPIGNNIKAIRSFNKGLGFPTINFKQEERGMKSQRENHSVFDQTTGTIFGSLVKGTDLMQGITY